MADHPSVCCMCGDIGFADKLFSCTKCRSRFQHSYCTNYYDELWETTVCDWCQSEERSAKHVVLSKRKHARGAMIRSEYSGNKIKEHDREESSSGRGKNANTSTSTSSPRSAGRRYKLLKDVLCGR